MNISSLISRAQIIHYSAPAARLLYQRSAAPIGGSGI
jgi:hypothetical protein